MKVVFSIVAALSLAACGDVANSTAELSEKVDAAIDEKAVAHAAASAVDMQAVKSQAEGVARDAINQMLPAGELGAIGKIVDESALIEGIDKAVDGKAIGTAVRDVVTDRTVEPAGKTAE